MKRNARDPMLDAIDKFWRDRREYLRLVALLHRFCAEEMNRNAPTDTDKHLLPNVEGINVFYCKDAINHVWMRLAYDRKTPLKKAAFERLLAVSEDQRADYVTRLILCNGRPYGAAALIADAAHQYYRTRHKTFHTKPKTVKGARAALLLIAKLGHGNSIDPGCSNALKQCALYVPSLVRACLPFLRS